MSASSKKKLRNELEAAKLTERQLAEQKEAKKVKLYTTAFALVMAAVLVIAATIGVTQFITTSGMREKNTVAMSINGTDLSNAELNYFYIDVLNNFYSQNGSYAALFGLDVTQPLNEQVYDDSTGDTWADYFLDSAKTNAVSVYAVSQAAEAEGFTLSEEDAASVESAISNMGMYAMLYGYGDAEAYVKAMYGNGASVDGYRTYVEKTLLANAYQTAYGESLVYEDAELRAAEAEKFDEYSSFAYNYYYLAASRFQEGGTTAEDGTTTYSDEEKAAAVAAAEEAAKALTAEEITTIEALDAAIAALPINAESTTAASTRYDAQRYTSITASIAQWLADDARAEGDMTYIANASTDAEGNETVSGYYVVRYDSTIDNTFALKNVRHILVGFEGGTTDETTGAVTYSHEEKAAAKATAEEILNEWKSGEATEASFAGLAAEKSTDTGSTANGGLYEDIYPGQMVEAFEDWCYDASRKAGDTGIVETEYGYHIMYFSGNSEETYRDYMIRSDLTSDAITEWYNGIMDSAAVTDGDVKYLSMDMVLSR